ncbi:MAG TPA: NADH-quinone oxidoreductase subunit M, partial [Chitinophagaceae bacterium]|nr:NADH-quinone oxidoreductase subunit M [Chitinophagaceae bacterium]
MLGTYITFPELLIWLPLLLGIISFFTSTGKAAKNLALAGSFLVLAVSVTTLFYTDIQAHHKYNNVNYYWLKYIGNSFNIGIDSTGRLLSFLTALAFPLIFLGTYRHDMKNAPAYFGLMLLAQAGLMGVFLAKDALVFYFFWELALIPVYFLCSQWGGEKRIPVTFKFFVYTFVGSLLMLIGILYVYQHTAARVFEDGTSSAHSFALAHFMNAQLTATEQNCLFWLFFVAFAIKMPIFPFHTWQPDT